MNNDAYEIQVYSIVDEAIYCLANMKNFRLYSLNIWTDLGAGVSSVSADSFENSERVERDAKKWLEKWNEEVLASEDIRLLHSFGNGPSRNTNPAEFELPNISTIEHADWDIGSEDDPRLWKLVDRVLLAARDRALARCRASLVCHPDAEISIGSKENWYDFPCRVYDTGLRKQTQG